MKKPTDASEACPQLVKALGDWTGKGLCDPQDVTADMLFLNPGVGPDADKRRGQLYAFFFHVFRGMKPAEVDSLPVETRREMVLDRLPADPLVSLQNEMLRLSGVGAVVLPNGSADTRAATGAKQEQFASLADAGDNFPRSVLMSKTQLAIRLFNNHKARPRQLTEDIRKRYGIRDEADGHVTIRLDLLDSEAKKRIEKPL